LLSYKFSSVNDSIEITFKNSISRQKQHALYKLAGGGEEMDIEIAILIAGVLIMVGAIVGGGAIYAGLEKLVDAMNKQK